MANEEAINQPLPDNNNRWLVQNVSNSEQNSVQYFEMFGIILETLTVLNYCVFANSYTRFTSNQNLEIRDAFELPLRLRQASSSKWD